ncbi:hypothetical protein KFK09_026398 [Dendrobium nobile]|uniref:Reverse transcriptase zinc-binding domain-containing protein n=1 Tax=Dendrobium nobile TaxID=94219 RepID=A0A8T3A7P9_DENNO|nr:hypothetical protein KFK09_026398 [Dendrobium nobile]
MPMLMRLFCNILNTPISTDPVKYLGIPIYNKRLKIYDFQPLLDRILGYLEGWKARSLTIAGKLHFITSNGWNLPSNFPAPLAATIKYVPICNSADECCWTKPAKPSFRNFVKQFYDEFENGLKTADALAVRGISVNPLCVFCKADSETKNHLLFECDFTFNILKYFMPRMNSMLLRPNLWQVFNDLDALESDYNKRNFGYLLLCAIVCWCPWTVYFGNHGLVGFLKDNDDCNLPLLPLDGLGSLLGNQGSSTIRLDYFGSLGGLNADCLLSP